MITDDTARQGTTPELPADWERRGDCVVCECGFRFGAEHVITDGTYSCPNCSEPESEVGMSDDPIETARGLVRYHFSVLSEDELHIIAAAYRDLDTQHKAALAVVDDMRVVTAMHTEICPCSQCGNLAAYDALKGKGGG